MPESAKFISLVTTVLNDREGTLKFFQQIEAQTHRPDEIVVVDGGSVDGTWEILQSYTMNGIIPLQCYLEAGCNVARGRNLAIEHAVHNIIVSTDIGCYLEPQWLEDLAQPLLEDLEVEAVMGSWKVRLEDLKSDWSKVEYALLNELQFIATPKSHASSRAIAYRKSLWQAIGGYPEDLTLAADDMVFALLLHQHTERVKCAPVPRCYWERPTALKSFCKEARRNFRGAGEAGIWLNHGILVGGRLFLEPFLLLLGIAWLLYSLPTWLGIVFLGGGLLSLWLRLFRLLPAAQRLKSYGYHYALLRLLYFEYLTKFWGIVGYWEGFFYGLKTCWDCRERLRRQKIA